MCGLITPKYKQPFEWENKSHCIFVLLQFTAIVDLCLKVDIFSRYWLKIARQSNICALCSKFEWDFFQSIHVRCCNVRTVTIPIHLSKPKYRKRLHFRAVFFEFGRFVGTTNLKLLLLSVEFVVHSTLHTRYFFQVLIFLLSLKFYSSGFSLFYPIPQWILLALSVVSFTSESNPK